MKRLCALACLLAGCASDPCDGKGAVCVSLRVQGSAPRPLDRLDVQVGLPDGRHYNGHTAPTSPFELPVAFALLLPPDALGHLTLDVAGTTSGAEEATGRGAVDVPPSGHAAATVTIGAPMLDLGPGSSDLAIADGPIASEGGVIDGGAADLAPGGIVLTVAPDPLLVLVNATASVTATITNHTGATITPTGLSATSVPTGAPLLFGSGNCLGTPLADGASCTADLDFSPKSRNRWAVTLTASFGSKLVPTTFAVDAIAWVDETPSPGVSNLLSVGGTSAGDVWAGGAVGTLMHRTGASTTWSGPVSPSPVSGSITSISAVPGGANVYMSGGAGSGYVRYSGGTFTPFTAPFAGAGSVLSIWSTSDTDFYLLSANSEILFGSVAASSTVHARDSSGLIALGGDTGNIYAVGGVFGHGVPTGSFSTSLFPGYTFTSVWSSGPNLDVFAVGAHTTGVTNAFVLRVDPTGNLHFQDFAGPASFYGVWGSSASDVFAVGSGGFIYHLDSPAGAWMQEASGVTQDLKGVWGAGGEVFAVGGNGTIVHRY
ncbi:MAG TPA: hypothetical protein VFF06_21725 [Polyangia bacterium]|nr:hypothetical protein [Polyangia bacterium]